MVFFEKGIGNHSWKPGLYPSFTISSKECKMGKLKLFANENRKLEYLQMLFHIAVLCSYYKI